jgi:hypothetical protein
VNRLQSEFQRRSECAADSALAATIAALIFMPFN